MRGDAMKTKEPPARDRLKPEGFLEEGVGMVREDRWTRQTGWYSGTGRQKPPKEEQHGPRQRAGADREVQGVSGSFTSRVGQRGSGGPCVWALCRGSSVMASLAERSWAKWREKAGGAGNSRGSDQAQNAASLQRSASRPPTWTHVAKGVAMEAVPPVSTPTADPMALGCPSPSPGVSPPAWP